MGNRRAFSLVELLTVVGIVAILIAMLLPAVSRAVEQSHQVKCLANLHDINLAAQSHIVEHDGYLPTAGWQWNCVDHLTNPRGLNDDTKRRYDYFRDDGVERPMPMTAALGAYLNVRCRTDSRADLEQDLQNDALRRLFHCPDEAFDYRGWTQRGDEGGSWIAPLEYSSYAFNEAVVGRREAPNTDRYPRGKISRCAHPSEVFFALDGRPRGDDGEACFLVFQFADGDTLYEFQQKILTSQLGKQLLDFGRHRMRINVVYLDGHADSFAMGLPPYGDAGELDRIVVSPGMSSSTSGKP